MSTELRELQEVEQSSNALSPALELQRHLGGYSCCELEAVTGSE